ncbi:uncharacterized protein LOC141889737 [Acropora palmata]|uniref:uncharacterized protein LOC141889737 n=1 Tax=Acropora palmata TaxID=6131 RepID=UPI003DA17C82
MKTLAELHTTELFNAILNIMLVKDSRLFVDRINLQEERVVVLLHILAYFSCFGVLVVKFISSTSVYQQISYFLLLGRYTYGVTVFLLNDFHNILTVRMPDNLKLSKAMHMACAHL